MTHPSHSPADNASASQALKELAERYGVETSYVNIWGQRHDAPAATLRAILNVFGVEADSDSDILAALAASSDAEWLRMLDPVSVTPLSQWPAPIIIRLPQEATDETLRWKLVEENGRTHHGDFMASDLAYHAGHSDTGGRRMEAFEWRPPVTLAPGYHLLSVERSGSPADEMALIIAPDACYLPEAFSRQAPAPLRLWGFATQLYALRSRRNWGIGDFTDLNTLMGWCANHGASIVGVNPLHELFPHHAGHISPYSPSSRAFFNTLYLDVEAIEEFAHCPPVQEMVQAPDFQAALQALREADQVDHLRIAERKRPVLERLYRQFREQHLEPKTARGKAFLSWCTQQGVFLEKLCTFQTLQEHFYLKDPMLWSWQRWPKAYQDPTSPSVAEYTEANRARVQYYQYLQWQADCQLAAVANTAQASGQPGGLYMDLAVGNEISGAEAWLDQALYVLTMDVGAPPDECNQKGQNWGLPPYHPVKLREVAYYPWIRVLRQNMRHAGALRLDHIMGLMRLFWSPKGQDATHGAYVRYPFEDLLGILALESHRNQCFVIGEDLGTVPPLVEERMRHWQILSYKLLIFERRDGGQFVSPADYPPSALAAISTHDLPTIAGYWQGEDIRTRAQLDLFPSEEFHTRQLKERVLERAGLLDALTGEGLLPGELAGYSLSNLPERMSESLMLAIHEYLARTRCHIMMAQLEDVFLQPEQANLPGTVDEHPNWRRKISVPLEAWDQSPAMAALTRMLTRVLGPYRS